MTSLPHLATRLINTPIAISAGHAELVVAALADRLGVIKLWSGEAFGALSFTDPDFEDEAAWRRGYDVVGGVAVIQVRGTLIQRLGLLRPLWGYLTGYDGLRQNLIMAMADESVDAIVFDIDSPGGEVAGCFDLVDQIVQARGTKPIWAILSECAYSAAYAIASATDKIILPRTGGVGSVGVIYMHVDISKALEKDGVVITLITDGDLKADGNPFEVLSKRAFDKLKADVQAVGTLFRDTVAANRGLTTNAVRDTEAGTFLGDQGVAIGFADAVMAPDAAFRALLAELG